jgi:hypothetical protein
MMRSLLLIIPAILLFSCANKFSIQKRKYNKGFYVASNGKKGVPSKKGSESTLELITKTSDSAKEIAIEETVTSTAGERSDLSVSTEPAVKKVITASAHKKAAVVTTPSIRPVQIEQNASVKRDASSSSKKPLYELFNGGGFYAIFGILSAIISLIFAIIYLAILFNAFSGAGFGIGGVLLVVGVIIVAAIIIGVLIVNSD